MHDRRPDADRGRLTLCRSIASGPVARSAVPTQVDHRHQHLADDQRTRGLADAPTARPLAERERRPQPALGPVPHAQHGIAGADGVADGRWNHDTDRRIDLVIYFVTAGAQHHRRPADEPRIEPGDEARRSERGRRALTAPAASGCSRRSRAGRRPAAR